MIVAVFALIVRIFLLSYERIAFKQASESRNSLISTFLLFSIAAVFLAPLLFFISWSLADFVYALISSIIYTVTFSIYIYVLANYDVSLVSPFYNFNVFFLLILSVIFLGESFSVFKVLGICLLFYGTGYLSKNNDEETSFFRSLKAVYKNRGCQLMMLMSLLMAVARIFDRININNIDPAFYSFALYFLISLFLGIIILATRKYKLLPKTIKGRWKFFLGGAGANAYSYLFLLIAITAIDLSIAEPLSMLSVIISIILSYFVFKEAIRERLKGAIIMFLGTILLLITI
jgi:transporter family protein